MPQQNIADINLAESQIVKDNPYKDVISEVKQLKSLIENQSEALRLKQNKLRQQIQHNQKSHRKKRKHKQEPNTQENQQAIENNENVKEEQNQKLKQEQDPLEKVRKQLQTIRKQIHIKQREIQTCSLRLQLLSLGNILTKPSHERLNCLQKIFNHYCHYIFKSGKHVTFDRIQYEKSHLIMERFFAFIHDFHLNKMNDDTKKQEQQIIPKHQLILIFKKSSANSRNLQFSQFIRCLQRLAILRFEFQQNYEERKLQQQLQRKRIKEINLRRLNEKQRRQKMKQEKQQRQRQQQLRRQAEQEQRIRMQQQALQNQPQQQSKEDKKEKKKKDKKKKKRQKMQSAANDNQSQSPDLIDGKSSNNNANQNNDDMLNQLMKKDASIQNPNHQFQRFKKGKQNQKESNPQLQALKRNQLLTLLKQEKVQFLYRLIQIDEPKAVENKLRQYEKPLFKALAQQRKGNLLNSSSVSKMRQTQMHHQQRLDQLKQKIHQKKKLKLRRSMSKSISDQKYVQKKKDDYEKYLVRAVAIKQNDNDALAQKTNNQYRKKNQGLPISLNMLNQSSEDTLRGLKLGNNIKRYFYPQEDDKVFLKEYGGLQKMRSSNSSYLQKSPRFSVDIKKRARQLQQAQRKNQQQKLQKFALQMYKNQHYMRRFLQRKS